MPGNARKPNEEGPAWGGSVSSRRRGDLEIPVIGKVPEDLDQVNPKGNRAYFKLLLVFYPLMRLIYDRKKHEASTLELVPLLPPNILPSSDER